jgi:7-cyano-7-deazaguanine synthase
MNVTMLYSGGLDSTALLYHLLSQHYGVRCLGVDYGQRHRRELECAGTIAERAGSPFRVVNLQSLNPLLQGSSLTAPDVPVPDGHYTDQRMKITVVPNRNMIMLAVATGWAISSKDDAVAFAAHAGDHPIYPDCRPEFADALERAIDLCNWTTVKLLRPFIGKTKAEVVKIGAGCRAPLELTWSCYKGGNIHCGTCGTCVERKEAFELAQVPDPTRYLA